MRIQQLELCDILRLTPGIFAPIQMITKRASETETASSSDLHLALTRTGLLRVGGALSVQIGSELTQFVLERLEIKLD